METSATPAKKGGGNGLMIAFVIVLALGIGTAVAYTMRKKNAGTTGNGAGESTNGASTGGITPEQMQAYNQAHSDNRIATSKVTLTESQKEAIRADPSVKIELSPEQAAQLKEYKTKKITGQMQNDTGDIMNSSFYN